MEKTFREKIALVVFAVLIVVSGIVLIGYFSTGRSWTIAATFVDDTVGEMDGYSVILFNGVLDPTTSKDEDGSHPDTVEDGADPAVDDASGSSDKAPDSVYGVDSGADAFLETKDGLIQDDSVLHGTDSSTSADSSIAFENSLLDPAHSVGLRILSMYPRAINATYDGVFVSDVSDLYARKGANVLSLNLTDPDHYEPPIVYYSGQKKIGVFSIDGYRDPVAMEEADRYMQEKGADVVVCITPRLALISDYDAIDVVILTTPLEDQSELSRSKVGGNTFVVQAPEKGDVGLVILSSNDIPSSRVIEVL